MNFVRYLFLLGCIFSLNAERPGYLTKEEYREIKYKHDLAIAKMMKYHREMPKEEYNALKAERVRLAVILDSYVDPYKELRDEKNLLMAKLMRFPSPYSPQQRITMEQRHVEIENFLASSPY